MPMQKLAINKRQPDQPVVYKPLPQRKKTKTERVWLSTEASPYENLNESKIGKACNLIEFSSMQDESKA